MTDFKPLFCRRADSTGSNVYCGGGGGASSSSSGQVVDVRLLRGAAVCAEMRAAVLRETGFTCSAGIRCAISLVGSIDCVQSGRRFIVTLRSELGWRRLRVAWIEHDDEFG